MRLCSSAAVVLAAGASRRMGEPKPLLPIGGLPGVVRAAHAFTDIEVPVTVVVDAKSRALVDLLRSEDVDVVINDAPERGMYSSVVAGLQAVSSSADWVAVLPADCPLVRAETVGRLLRTAMVAEADVILPVQHGRRGHPPLLGRRLRDTAVTADPCGGLRDLFELPSVRRIEVDVDDVCVVLDMDRRADYLRLEELAATEQVPQPDECRRLLDEFGTPAPVREHSGAVATAALALGSALNEVGAALHLGLLLAAALLHDIARAETDHARAGATLLRAAGFPRVGAVVASHMDLAQPLSAIPGEAEILYLADKLVLGSRVMSLEQRIDDMLSRTADDVQAATAARRRLDAALCIAASVERLTGRRLSSLVPPS